MHLLPPKSGSGFSRRSLKKSFGSSLLFFTAPLVLPFIACPTRLKPSPTAASPARLTPSPATPVDSEGFGVFSSPLRNDWVGVRR
jgi:hypothetical protein